MPFGFQPIHLVVVFIVALIIFGPHRLPEIGRGLGKAIVEFRKGARDFTDSFSEEINGASTPKTPYPAVTPTWTSAPATGNFCIHCGAPNPGDALFCNRCGAQLPGKTFRDQTAPPTPAQTEESQPPLEMDDSHSE